MEKPEHLQYISMPLEWYVSEHNDRQRNLGNSHSRVPAYSLDQLLTRNKDVEYKGVHHFCGAEEMEEILTCVIFKKERKGKQAEYYHVLYLGPETQHSEAVHEKILQRLGLNPDQYQRSLISKH